MWWTGPPGWELLGNLNRGVGTVTQSGIDVGRIEDSHLDWNNCKIKNWQKRSKSRAD